MVTWTTAAAAMVAAWAASSSSAATVAMATAMAGEAGVNVRGLTPELRLKLASATTFVCDGGARTLPIARLNDNYCDCEDGADEPGTPACSHTPARFHCANAGFFAKNIPTSRVNDLVCDCCDGSDEYGSAGVACLDDCKARKEKFMVEKRELLEVFERGSAARAELVTAAAAQLADERTRLGDLETQVQELERGVQEWAAVKEQEELLETKERMDKTKETKREMLRTLGLADLSTDQLGFIILELANAAYTKDDLLRYIKVEREGMTESVMELEEAAWKERDAARKEEADRIEKLKEERRKAKEEAKEKARQEAEAAGKEYVEEEEAEAEEELQVPPVEERPVKLLFDKMQTLGTHERPEAKTARDTYYEKDTKLTSTRRELNDLKTLLDKSFGDDNILFALRDQCFKTQGGQYTYSMCFYGSAKQDSVSLGDMQAITAGGTPTELAFTGGQACWNGPSRSLTVTMECGATNELYQVDEPSMCVYTARLKTPVMCVEEYKSRLLSGDEDGSESNKPHHIEVEVSATL